MIFNLNGTIDRDAVSAVISVLNSLDVTENGIEDLTIYLQSNGGSTGCSNAIANILNNHKGKLEVIAYESILSSGFTLFFKLKCKKSILSETSGMYHLSVVDGNPIYEGGKLDSYGEFCLKEMVYNFLDGTNKLVGFTDKEIKDMKNSKDVWFSEKRLKQMLTFNKKYLKNAS